MKKIFITAIVIIITVLAAPAVRTFAEKKALEDIPARNYSESSKAYCLYEENDGEYVLTCINSNGTKQLYKSKEKFEHYESFSEDGETVFYSINNTVYRYSYQSGKRKKIYTAQNNGSGYAVHIYPRSSPSGEYCFICVKHPSGYNDYDIDLIISHDGKTVSQTETTNFGSYGGDTLFGINNKGELFYTLDRDIYILDFNGKRLVEKAPELSSEEDYKYRYKTEVFKEKGTYFITSKTAVFYGEIGGERHTFSILPDCSILCKNGDGFIAYNGEAVSRYDMKSGKSRNILKISPEKYSKNRFNFMAVSDDMNEIVYINYSKKKLVRLSDWNAQKNCYTNKQEIKLNGTGCEYISTRSPDLNVVLIARADTAFNHFKADFVNESFEQTEYYLYETDRFGHNIIKSGGKIEILNPDGSPTEVFDGVGATCEPWLSNGFYCFYSGGPDVPCDYEGKYDLTYYYICPKGKAVKWYDLENTYMECHYLEDWEHDED